jgi:hypothetical protein
VLITSHFAYWIVKSDAVSGVRLLIKTSERLGNHQGLDNRLIMRAQTAAQATGNLRKRQRLGGMLNYYYRAAA